MDLYGLGTVIVIDRDAVVSIVLVIALFAVPNLATVFGGFRGFYIAYISWGVLVAISLPIVIWDRGCGSIDTGYSVALAIALVSLYTFLGFVWGFNVKPRPSISSFIVSLAIFLIATLGIEIPRGIVIRFARSRLDAAIILGIAVGLFFGGTIHTVVNYIARIPSSPLTLVRDLVYSLLLTLMHIYGGFISALVFRVLVDGYWRFSPIVLNTAKLGTGWNIISILISYSIVVYILYSIPRLRGYAKEVFNTRRLKRYIGMALDGATYALLISLILMISMRIIPLVVVSGSMRPTLDVGDIVLIDARKPLNISVGDLIAFRFENMIVIHRVVEILGDGFRTKGDANPDPDPFIVKPETVIGKAVGSIPRLGIVAIVAQGSFSLVEPYMLYIAIAAIVTMTTLLCLRVRHRHSRLLKT